MDDCFKRLWTGLTDCNGKNIQEGDIVDMRRFNVGGDRLRRDGIELWYDNYFVVKWENGGFHLEEHGDSRHKLIFQFYHQPISDHGKVLGNVYEHSCLLEIGGK